MTTIENDVSFRSFGKPFQERILQALLSDHAWARQMLEVLRPEYFEINYLRYLFEIYKKHYDSYKTLPSMQLLATIAHDDLREGNDEILCGQIVAYLQSIKDNPNTNDLPYIKDRSLNFCKNQALKEALEHAVDLTKEQKYEEIVGHIKKAITVGTSNTTGHDFFADFEQRFMKNDRNVVPTGIPALDDKHILNGGLGRGELSIILASSGIGKSHFLVQVGANAMRAGKNVLHYTLELNERHVGIRYDANFSGISATDVPDEKEFIRKRYEELQPTLGRLIIKEFPTNSVTVIGLKAHIEKLAVVANFVPDIIIVDYADIMRSTRQYDALRHELKLVYEELRGLGQELRVPVLTASQSNRDSTDSDVVGLDKIAESFGKVAVCDFIVSLSRRPLQKATNLGNLFIAKNRFGKDGIVFPVRVDTARSIIEVLDKNIDLEEFERTHENDMKKLLKEQWNNVANTRLWDLRKVDKIANSKKGE